MNLYLIRHLPTPWNQKGLLQGSKNISIIATNPEIEDQILKNKELLREIRFDEILVSELKRTHETAKLYGFDSCKVDALVNELDFGKYEGIEKTIMLKELGEAWFNDVRSIKLGETLLEFEARILLFLEKYKNKENVLLFAHGAVIRAILELSKEKNIDRMNMLHVENNSLTKVEINL